MATKIELRELLPGPGELKEIIDNVLDQRPAPDPEDLDSVYEITDEEAKEILDDIIEWAAEDGENV